MDQADPSPTPSARLQRVSRLEPNPRACTRFDVGLWPSCPNRNGEPLLAVPEGGGGGDSLLAGLRARIAALERGSPACRPSSGALRERACADGAWTLGAPEIDRRFAGGLNAAALHEIKPEGRPAAGAAGEWAAALGFGLRLAARRLQAPGAGGNTRLLWCWPSALAREIGLPYGAGFAALGVRASCCLFVESARAAEALWAMEEGLKSASLALVVGVLKEAALTPARRLSLAAAGQETPCLLITDSRTPAAGASATRWRVGARPSAPDPLAAGAPGASRYAVSLERCREGAPGAEALSLLLEWSDETHRFRVAPVLADRAPGPRRAGRGAR